MEMLNCELAGIEKTGSGKVREVFAIGDDYLMVATDRISAFDCILPTAIPEKGRVLNNLSAFWFHKFDFFPNHLITENFHEFPKELEPFREQLEGRSMLVKKCSPIPVECVARGYLVGSAWAEYKVSGTVCGIELPSGLQQAEKLPNTIFTPARKAATGHDENISWHECCSLVGDEIATRIREATIKLYEHGCAHAAQRGIIVADTKFEFGLRNGEILLIDECLTPDSSRFWSAADYAVGSNPPSFDKQFVRDYLDTLDWDKTPPAPALPQEVVKRTSEKYCEALRLLIS